MEPAMSTITMTIFRSTHSSHWDQLKLRITEWQRRARSRRELEALSDATMRDIGMTRFLDGLITGRILRANGLPGDGRPVLLGTQAFREPFQSNGILH
jgi:uncharacterized protein YjiS (DUF1127 family)